MPLRGAKTICAVLLFTYISAHSAACPYSAFKGLKKSYILGIDRNKECGKQWWISWPTEMFLPLKNKCKVIAHKKK